MAGLSESVSLHRQFRGLDKIGAALVGAGIEMPKESKGRKWAEAFPSRAELSCLKECGKLPQRAHFQLNMNLVHSVDVRRPMILLILKCNFIR